MIVDVEVRREGDPRFGKLSSLNISHFDKNGDTKFLEIPLNNSTEGYIWEYANGRLDKPDEQYRSWDNKPVKKVKTSNINKYTIEEILYHRRDEILPALEYNEPKKFSIDIETEITDGFPDPEFALNKVTAIAIANCTDKKITVLGLRDMTEMDHDKIQNDINVHFKKYPNDKWAFRYIKFESEYDMLYTFFGKLMNKMPCITGWNVLRFDWMYLVNRAERIKINPAIAGPLRGRDRIPQHKLIIDYLDIVKKWDRVIKIKENYKLDYIAERATGIAKIKYPGTLKSLYDNDFVKFIFYNAVDAILVHYIDQKLNTMTTFLKLGHIAQVEINRAFSPVWVQEALMCREFLRRDKVFIDTNKDTIEQKHFVGAWVKEPIIGMHEWVACYDFASLYPNCIMQFNISPEMYLGKSTSGMVEERQIICANGNVFDNTNDSVLRVILQDLYGQRKTTKVKMLDINKEIDFLKRYLLK